MTKLFIFLVSCLMILSLYFNSGETHQEDEHRGLKASAWASVNRFNIATTGSTAFSVSAQASADMDPLPIEEENFAGSLKLEVGFTNQPKEYDEPYREYFGYLGPDRTTLYGLTVVLGSGTLRPWSDSDSYISGNWMLGTSARHSHSASANEHKPWDDGEDDN